MKNIYEVISYYSNITWNGIYLYDYSVNYHKGELFLDNAINLYLEYIRCSKSQNTHYCYSRDLHYLLKKIGNVKLNSITEEILQGVSSEITGKGIKKPFRSGTTLNRIKSVYRSFFSWCFKKTTSAKIYRAKFALQNLLRNTLLQ